MFDLSPTPRPQHGPSKQASRHTDDQLANPYFRAPAVPGAVEGRPRRCAGRHPLRPRLFPPEMSHHTGTSDFPFVSGLWDNEQEALNIFQ